MGAEVDRGEELALAVREALGDRPVRVAASLGDSVSVFGENPKDVTAAYYAAIGAGFAVRDSSRWEFYVTDGPIAADIIARAIRGKVY